MIEFDWDKEKNTTNFLKHGVRFEEAMLAFTDPQRLIIFDDQHSHEEKRWFCLGIVDKKVMTVRYTLRDNKIRIIGAGYWRQGRKRYEQQF